MPPKRYVPPRNADVAPAKKKTRIEHPTGMSTADWIKDCNRRAVENVSHRAREKKAKERATGQVLQAEAERDAAMALRAAVMAGMAAPLLTPPSTSRACMAAREACHPRRRRPASRPSPPRCCLTAKGIRRHS
jgi:hypothetical protein